VLFWAPSDGTFAMINWRCAARSAGWVRESVG
jgi:hypothetical protein